MRTYLNHLSLRVLFIPTSVVLLMALSGCISNQDRAKTASVEDLEWIKGNWHGTNGMERHEEWQQISGQSLNGKSWLIEEQDTLSKAVMKIHKPKDRVQYIIRKRNDMEPSKLELESLGHKKAVFTNKNGETPRSITYWSNGDKLTVIVQSKNKKRSFDMNKASSS